MKFINQMNIIIEHHVNGKLAFEQTGYKHVTFPNSVRQGRDFYSSQRFLQFSSEFKEVELVYL